MLENIKMKLIVGRSYTDEQIMKAGYDCGRLTAVEGDNACYVLLDEGNGNYKVLGEIDKRDMFNEKLEEKFKQL